MNIGFVLALLSALADWYAVARQHKTLEYVFKPAALVFVIVGTLLLWASPHDIWQGQWFLAGFFFSLLGDIFLVLPNPRWFLFGLGSFLLAHICFILGLNPDLPSLDVLVVLVPCALAVGFVLARVISSLRAQDHSSLIPPVSFYGVAMTLMLASAWATLLRPEWTMTRRVFAIAGATLFFVSDGILAWNRFVKPFPTAKLAIIITYHLGQLALALSIAE